MKGFDALCLAMVPEFLRADLKRPIHILLSYDEEIGCRGPLDTIARFGGSAAAGHRNRRRALADGGRRCTQEHHDLSHDRARP